jgi:hypothetical protein
MPPNELPEVAFTGTMKDALVALQELKLRGLDEPAEPTALPIDAIEPLTAVFQVRGGEIDERHVSTLLAVLKAGRELDPVMVWRCGRHTLLIDGHHRLEAYALQRSGTSTAEVPVQWLRGTPADAVKAAAEANAKPKLQMTHPQRANLAWRLTAAGGFTKAETAAVAGVSTGLVATMRRVNKALGEDAELYITWWEAQKAFKGTGQQLSHEDMQAKLDLMAQTWADRMSRAFSSALARNPEVAAKALAIHLGRKAQDVAGLLLEELGERNPFEDDEEERLLGQVPF